MIIFLVIILGELSKLLKNKNYMKDKFKRINYKDIIVNMKVKNKEGITGVVKKCEDIHNIFVEYDNGGSGLYCLVKKCTETIIKNDEEIVINQYEPLYYI